MNNVVKKRPEFRNINILKDVRTYRLPIAAKLSILHRVSGGIMFVLLPFILWMFNLSLTSPDTFSDLTKIFREGLWIFPAFLVKLGLLVLIWAYLHHICAGIRHLCFDFDHHLVNKKIGRSSAIIAISISLVLTALLGAKLFGLY